MQGLADCNLLIHNRFKKAAPMSLSPNSGGIQILGENNLLYAKWHSLEDNRIMRVRSPSRRRPRSAVILADFVDGRHIGVIQPGGGVGVAGETFP
jgi:hypothetical protein